MTWIPGAIRASDSPSVDAFGRWRVSSPVTLFDSKQLHDNQPLFWDDAEVSGSGTGSSHSTNTAMTTMSVSNATAGKRVRQTFMRFNYQPGKSQRIFMTCANLECSTGIVKGFGIGDDNNGLFLVNDEGTLKFVRRTYVTGSAVDNETEVTITLEDGSEPDLSTTMILDIDFEWLGVGRVRAGYVTGASVRYFFTFAGLNNLSTVYMSTPNLPLRYWIENDGNGAADTFGHICSSVQSEGGREDQGIIFSDNLGGAMINANTALTTYPLIGIRLKSTHLDAIVNILEATVLAQTSDDFQWSLRFNPTITGTFTYASYGTYSAVEIAKGDTAGNPSATTVTSPGQIMRSGLASANAASAIGLKTSRHIGSSIAGTRDTIVLCVTPLGSGTVNADISGTLTWRELN